MKLQTFIVYIITAFCLLASPLHPVAQDSGIEKNKKWNDFLKDIEIGPGKLNIDGSLRFRSELFEQFSIKKYGTDDEDGILLERFRLGLDYRINENLNFYVQLQDAHYWFSELDLNKHFGDVCPYQNPLDLKQANMEWKHIADTPFGFKAGRQAIAYRDLRVWGPGNWGNTGSFTWDAVKFYADTDWVDTDLIWARRVISDKDHFDDEYYDFTAYGMYSKIQNLPVDLDLFYLLKKDGEETYAGEFGLGDLETHSLGFYASGHFLERWDWKGTFAYQLGEYGQDDINAFMVNTGAGYTFKDTPWTPRLGAEFSYGSGDDDPNDGDRETFDALFGAVAPYYGRMNMFSLKNLEDYQASLGVKPAKNINLSLNYHYFRLAEAEDGWYYCHKKVHRQDPTGLSGRDLGHEIDLLTKWKVNPNIELFSGFAHFFPENYIDNTGISEEANWFFVQCTFFF